MRHPSLEITDEQEANLRKLAAYLMTQVKPEQFDMSDFMNGPDDEYPRLISECGTVACAVGYGPSAGIDPLGSEEWENYIERAFTHYSSNEWQWCFSVAWADVDNTAAGAAKHILWMLEFGVPHYVYDMFEDAALCYLDWAPSEATT